VPTEKMDEVAFYDLVDKEISTVLSRVPGVAQVNITGGQEEIQINLDAVRMQAYGLCSTSATKYFTLTDFPNRKYSNREKKILIRLAGNIVKTKKLNCFFKNGIQIRLGDIADVQDTQNNGENCSC
jgi:HAE1 family hydrophobic/amphiphilic exporter-1